MIGPTGAVRVMVATKPVDFRKGAEGLAALVRETMAADPFSGAVYVFRAKRVDEFDGDFSPKYFLLFHAFEIALKAYIPDDRRR